jgi:acetoin utilization deacetylase AcuC-like enzyme
VIKRENIKQAIDAIGSRAPKIGSALDELLSVGRIDAAGRREEAEGDTDFFFLFDREKVRVRKFIFINEGLAPIERGLLIRYGELLRKRELAERPSGRDFIRAASEVRRAGLKLLVDYELEAALAKPREKSAEGVEAKIARLAAIRDEDPPQGLPRSPPAEGVIFRGALEDLREAQFIRFPFCREALMQVADINLEFFHVRFLLSCLARGQEGSLFACTLEGRILGLLFLSLKSALFDTALEIKYIATLRGRKAGDESPPPRGVGRFLVAGAWLLWRTAFRRARELALDSEVGARGFYARVGFGLKRPNRYALTDPSPDLLRTVLTMVENSPGLPPEATLELSRRVVKQIAALGRRGRNAATAAAQAQVHALAQTALAATTYPAIAAAATRALLRCGRSLSELDHLLAVAARNPEIHRTFTPGAAPSVGVVCDDRFQEHLEGVFHLENAKRFAAIRSVVLEAAFRDKLIRVTPREATAAELAWVHTPAYIARVAETAGRPLSSLDLDTQTTEKSYATACLAAGAVFSLLEEIWCGRIERGFAAVRPPGHHAEPDRGMGFCLFNNAALGARYLRHRHGVKRVMLVDIDAHHGNGAQAVFYDTDEVLCVSIHQFPGFPGTGRLGEIGRAKGEGYTVNVPLPKGQGDDAYLCILHHLVRPLAHAYRPEILLVPCGFDLWLHDRLAEMRVTPDGYGLMTALLCDLAAEVCGGRIAFVMEGGYSAEGIRECGLRVFQALMRPAPSHLETLHQIAAENPNRIPALKKAIEVQRPYWGPHLKLK